MVVIRERRKWPESPDRLTITELELELELGSLLGPNPADRVHRLHWCRGTIRSSRSELEPPLFSLTTSKCIPALLQLSHGCRQRVSACINELQKWCASCRLQLNVSKTELIWFGSPTFLGHLTPDDRVLVLEIGPAVVQPSDVVRDFGVLLDSELTMKRSVMSMRQSVSSSTATATWTGILWNNWFALSFTQPSALYNVYRTMPHASHLAYLHMIMSVRVQHWKNCTVYQSLIGSSAKWRCKCTCSIHVNRCTRYLRDSVVSAGSFSARHHFPSATNLNYILARTRTKFGESLFCFSAHCFEVRTVCLWPSDCRRLWLASNATWSHIFKLCF